MSLEIENYGKGMQDYSGYCVEEEEGIYIHCYRKPILIGKVFGHRGRVIIMPVIQTSEVTVTTK